MVAVKTPEGARIQQLDGIRGVAIAMVLLCHCALFSPVAPRGLAGALLWKVGAGCWIGVDLFFCLSGYLITKGLLARGPGALRNFFIGRVMRIFPLYYLLLFIIFDVLPRTSLSSGYLLELVHQQAWYWCYLSNIHGLASHDYGGLYLGHAWSLAIEEQFYMVWPVVVLRCSDDLLRRVVTWTPVVSVVARTVLVAGLGVSGFSVRIFPLGRLEPLAFGAGIALAERCGVGRRQWFDTRPRCAIAIASIGYLACLQNACVRDTLGYTFVAVACAGFLQLALSHECPAFLKWEPLGFLGRYSYSVYLWHLLMLLTVRQYLTLHSYYASVLLLFTVLMAASFPFGAIVFRCVEEPLMRVRRRVVRSLDNRVVCTPA